MSPVGVKCGKANRSIRGEVRKSRVRGDSRTLQRGNGIDPSSPPDEEGAGISQAHLYLRSALRMNPHFPRHRAIGWNVLMLLLGLTAWMRTAAQPVVTTTSYQFVDVDGDGRSDLSLKRIEDRKPEGPFTPPSFWRVQWILEPLGTTSLIQFDGTVSPGSFVRTTDGQGQSTVPSLLILDTQWRAQSGAFDTTWGNSTAGPVIDAQAQGRKSAYVGIRMGTNGTLRTGWVRFITGFYPYTTNWPKEYLYSFAPFTWNTAVSETLLAPDTNTVIRIGQGPGDGLHFRRRTFDWILEIPDANSASRLETSLSPLGPWSPAMSEWELTIPVSQQLPADGIRTRYYRVRPL